jgi:hypothetical protein
MTAFMISEGNTREWRDGEWAIALWKEWSEFDALEGVEQQGPFHEKACCCTDSEVYQRKEKNMSVSDDIQGLFDGLDGYLLLCDDEVVGGDGIYGLHLVANCLHAYFALHARPKLVTKTARAIAARKALKALTPSREKWVVCFQFNGSNDWEMAWSSNLTPDEAYRQVILFIQCGMALE